MKKILWSFALAAIVLQACKKDNDDEETVVTEVVAETLSEQNTWDDSSILEFLDKNYFDEKGNIKAFDDKDDSDNNEVKLSTYPLEKLPSGVIYIKRNDSFQPNPGKTINDDDAISIMHNTVTYVATKNVETGKISFTSQTTFANTISGSGVPLFDPSFFHVKKTVLDNYNNTNSTSYDKSFYQIEGLKEGLSHFKSFELDNSANYNLQGVIIVPSRAAFARDPHYPYLNFSWANRTFVFNFQIYNTKSRTEAGD